MTKFEPVGYLPTGEELWPYKDGTIVLPSPPGMSSVFRPGLGAVGWGLDETRPSRKYV